MWRNGKHINILPILQYYQRFQNVVMGLPPLDKKSIVKHYR